MNKPVLREKHGRRRFVGGATAAFGASIAATMSPGIAAASPGPISEQVGPIQLPLGVPRTYGVLVNSRARKPIYLADPSAGITARAVAEVLFWIDIMMEHALFFSLLMPGDRLRAPREDARKYQTYFAQIFLYARDNAWRDDNVTQLLGTARSAVSQFITYKRNMEDAQARGTLQSLVWPLFFDHTAREAQRFVGRIDQLAAGNVALTLDEVKAFWSTIMAEHLEFVAHLLDPQERALVDTANEKAAAWYDARARPTERVALASMVNDVIDFKTAAEQGIETGKIRSIIDPALADHVLREAVKFSDEVQRA